MNQRISVLAFVSIAVFVLATNSVQAEESGWTYPQSKLHTKAGSEAQTAGWPNETVDVRSTEDSVKKVVAYYVKQSGLESPNWEYLGREFPSPKQSPVGCWIGQGKTGGNAARVSITQDFRPDVAQVTFLVVAESGNITAISITRGKNEDQTWIQVHGSAFKTIVPLPAAQRTNP